MSAFSGPSPDVSAATNAAALFWQLAPTLLKASVIVDGVFLLVNIVQFGVCIWAFTRSGGHRAPYVLLTFALGFAIASHAFDIASFIEPFDANAEPQTLIGVDAVDSIVNIYSSVLLLMATLFVTYNRFATLELLRPEAGLSHQTAKKIFDWIFFAAMFLFGAAYIGIEDGAFAAVNIFESITPDQFNTIEQAGKALLYVFTGFFLLTILNLIVSSIRLKVKQTSLSIQDSPANTLVWVVCPLFFLHGGYFLFEVIYPSLPNSNITDNIVIILNFVSVVEICVIPFFIVTALLWLGLKPSLWGATGQPASAEYTTPEEPKYPQYPVQQPYQPYGSQQYTGQPGAAPYSPYAQPSVQPVSPQPSYIQQV